MIACLLLVGCGKFRLYNADQGPKVVSVGESVLYEHELEQIFTRGMTPKDSLSLREKFIKEWVSEQVMRQASQQELSSREKEIEQRVEAYRASLMRVQFQDNFLAKRLDTLVTTAQIEEYYNKNRENFRLAGPMVKARVARLPSGLRLSKKLEEMFRHGSEQQTEDFVNICNKNNYRLDDYTSEWTDFSLVLEHIPFSAKNFDEFLSTKSYYEVEDEDYKYMMVIEQYLPTGESSPVGLQSANIRKILLHDRRTALIMALQDSLLGEAKRDKLIEFYTPNNNL